MPLWAVYDRLDGLHPIVWPLNKCRTGEYVPLFVVNMPPIAPLPLKVYRSRSAAERAIARLLWDCAGTA